MNLFNYNLKNFNNKKNLLSQYLNFHKYIF